MAIPRSIPFRPNFYARAMPDFARIRQLELPLRFLEIFIYLALMGIVFGRIYEFFFRFQGNEISQIPLVAWIPASIIDHYASVLFLVNIALLIANFYFGKRWLRILFFIGFTLQEAIISSYGNVRHSMNAPVWIAFSLCFLADWFGPQSARSKIMTNLTVVWWSFLLLCFTYSMSAFWKIVIGIIIPLFKGKMTYLSPQALPSLIASTEIKLNYSSLLGNILVAHPGLALIASIVVLLAQLFSIYVPFTMRLLVPWFLTILSFHVFSLLILGIFFKEQVTLLILFAFLIPYLLKRRCPDE